ncbi:exportin-5 [Aureococcus anophagefferens]|nr:exportin-5 [Aureococcus anophagefferens]
MASLESIFAALETEYRHDASPGERRCAREALAAVKADAGSCFGVARATLALPPGNDAVAFFGLGCLERKAAVLAAVALREFPQRWPGFVGDVLADGGGDASLELGLGALAEVAEDCIDADYNGRLPAKRRADVLKALNARAAVVAPRRRPGPELLLPAFREAAKLAQARKVGARTRAAVHAAAPRCFDAYGVALRWAADGGGGGGGDDAEAYDAEFVDADEYAQHFANMRAGLAQLVAALAELDAARSAAGAAARASPLRRARAPRARPRRGPTRRAGRSWATASSSSASSTSAAATATARRATPLARRPRARCVAAAARHASARTRSSSSSTRRAARCPVPAAAPSSRRWSTSSRT